MATQQQAQSGADFTIHPGTRLGHVHYTVASLDRQISFYETILGFKVHWREGAAAGLGAGGEDLLRLTEVPGARRVHGTTGLYHTAFLVPTWWELAQLLKRVAETRTPIQGMSNHGTHYAIYLPDAEGNGIELARDFPPDQWPATAQEMLSGNRGLHPDEVFKALDDKPGVWQGLDSGTTVGHVHLHVANLPSTHRFYREVLGFDIPLDFSAVASPIANTALFFSAGGYHHHIGTNIWQGENAPPPPDDAAGLRYFSVVLPDKPELERVLVQVEAAGIASQEVPGGVLVRDAASNGVLLSVD